MIARNIAKPLQGTFKQAASKLVNVQNDSDQQPKKAIIKSPLRYPGGKTRAVKQIIELLPPDLDRLCSPFIGGGSIELACVSRGVKVFGYDKFDPLVNFWQVVLEDAPGLAKLVKKYHPMSKTKFYALQKRYFKLKDRKRMAAIFFALNRCSFSGTTLSGGMSPEHPRFTASAIERLTNFEAKGLRVEHADFPVSLKQHKNDFLYLDPPYANGGRLYGERGDMHEAFNHEQLAKMLVKRNGWILSYNDCNTVRHLYDGFKFINPSWTYGMNNSKKSNEVLILSKDFIRMI